MTKNEKLDELFAKWQTQQKYVEFVKDGIIDEQLYNTRVIKVLFVARERNGGGYDFREGWKHGLEENGRRIMPADLVRRNPLDRALARWAYGIQNEFRPLEKCDDDQFVLALQGSAFMNLKKTPGNKETDMEAFEDFIHKDKKYILDEIEIISPDIIVTPLKTQSLLADDLFEDYKSIEVYGVRSGKWRNSKIINYYHPSYRICPHMAYCHLKAVVQSNAFRNL